MLKTTWQRTMFPTRNVKYLFICIPLLFVIRAPIKIKRSWTSCFYRGFRKSRNHKRIRWQQCLIHIDGDFLTETERKRKKLIVADSLAEKLETSWMANKYESEMYWGARRAILTYTDKSKHGSYCQTNKGRIYFKHI